MLYFQLHVLQYFEITLHIFPQKYEPTEMGEEVVSLREERIYRKLCEVRITSYYRTHLSLQKTPFIQHAEDYDWKSNWCNKYVQPSKICYLLGITNICNLPN